jgi:hypothetical protein
MYVIFLILLLIFCIFICIIHKKFGGAHLGVCLNDSDNYKFEKADDESDVLIIGYKKENGIKMIMHSGKNNNNFEIFDVLHDEDYDKIQKYFVKDIKKAIFAMCENDIFAYIIDGIYVGVDDILVKDLLNKKYKEIFQ